MTTRRFAALSLPLLALLGSALIRAQSPTSPPPSQPTAATPAPPSQPSEVTLELSRNQKAKIRLAIPKYAATGFTGAEGSAAGAELESTVRRDLDFSGYFEIQGPEQLSGLTLTGDLLRDRDVYRS
ncbi:MAG TPA: hypothetical protein VN851_26645, partial [Thermoanaerobaculia bacterium]|nr:hypothetical protein [Thermoanaerobaculia bacterium]